MIHPDYYKNNLFPIEKMAGGHIYGVYEDYCNEYTEWRKKIEDELEYNSAMMNKYCRWIEEKRLFGYHEEYSLEQLEDLVKRYSDKTMECSQLLSSEQIVQGSDATEADSSNTVK